jgi:hypothetical protein
VNGSSQSRQRRLTPGLQHLPLSIEWVKNRESENTAQQSHCSCVGKYLFSDPSDGLTMGKCGNYGDSAFNWRSADAISEMLDVFKFNALSP